MNLRDYLYHNRISVSEFSETIDYSRTHISGVLHGKLRPSSRLARAIEKATNGEVTVEELMKDIGKEGE